MQGSNILFIIKIIFFVGSLKVKCLKKQRYLVFLSCFYHPEHHVSLLKPSWRTRNSKLDRNFNMLFKTQNCIAILEKHPISLSLDNIYLVIDCICALQLVCTKQRITKFISQLFGLKSTKRALNMLLVCFVSLPLCSGGLNRQRYK